MSNLVIININNLVSPVSMVFKEFVVIFLIVTSLVFFTIVELTYKINSIKNTYYVSIFYTVTLFMVINLILYSFFLCGDESKFFLFNFSLTNLYGHNFLLSILIFFFVFIFVSSISEKKFTNIKYIPFESNFILGFLFIGIIFLIYSFDFLTMFLNLELQNFALYILMNIQRNKKIVVETSIKYYIIGGVSSGFILYGISLIYLSTGKINFFDLILYFYNIQDFNSILFLGILFIFCGLFIKLGLAPFHFWVPQIYSGAPNFIMLILLSLPKFVLILVFIKLYFFVFSFIHNIFFPIISFSIIISLIFGSIGALWQINVKQFFAYSAITNTGFILLGLTNFSSITLFSGYFYLVIYLLTTIVTFYSFMVIKSRQYNVSQSVSFYDFTSLILINPVLLFTISINFLSFAGIPPLPGFFTKFFILMGLVELEQFKFVFFTMLVSIIAAYYFIRPIKIMFFSISTKPKFFVDFPFFVVLIFSVFFFFNLQFIYHLSSVLNIFESFDINFCNFFISNELITYKLGSNFYFFDKSNFGGNFFLTNFINIKGFSPIYNLSLSIFLIEPSIFVKTYILFNTGLTYNNIIFLHGYIHLWNYHPDIFLDSKFNLIKPLLLKQNYCKVYYYFYILKSIPIYNKLFLTGGGKFTFFNQIDFNSFCYSEPFLKIIRFFFLEKFRLYFTLNDYFTKLEASFNFNNLYPIPVLPLGEGIKSQELMVLCNNNNDS